MIFYQELLLIILYIHTSTENIEIHVMSRHNYVEAIQYFVPKLFPFNNYLLHSFIYTCKISPGVFLNSDRLILYPFLYKL